MTTRPRNTIVEFTDETFDSIRTGIVAALKSEDDFKQWTDHLPSDMGMVLVEVFAGLADMFRFHQNVTATESFPATARSRASLCRQAEWFGYYPHAYAAAQVDLTFTKTNTDVAATIPAKTRVSTSDGEITFETVKQLYIPPGQAYATVGAINGVHVEGQIIGVSTGAKNQEFQLLNTGLVMLAEGEYSLSVYIGGQEWTQFPSLPWAAGENGWRLWIDSDGEAYVRLGDGTYGNIPTTGDQVVVEYITGGGVDGNVGANTLTAVGSSLSNVTSVTNESAASGGADEETTEELRANLPSVAITRGRAVTRDDYERLAEVFGEIDKVDVDHPSANIVKLFILPQGGATPSATLLTAVATYFTDIRMITEDLQVLAPTIVLVDVGCELVIHEDADSSEVVSDVTAGLRSMMANADFNTTVYIQDVYNYLETHDDIVHATVTILSESGAGTVVDIVTEPGEILAAGQVTVEVTDA